MTDRIKYFIRSVPRTALSAQQLQQGEEALTLASFRHVQAPDPVASLADAPIDARKAPSVPRRYIRMLSVANKVADSVSHSPEDTLLRILRDPTSLIESVHEEYRIEDWDVDTVTQIRFNADRLKNVDWFYLDVQTPEKGEIGAYEILTPNVTPVVHNEHMRIAKACIRNRLTILARSIRF